MTTVKIDQLRSAILEAEQDICEREQIACGKWFPRFESYDELIESMMNEVNINE